MIDEDNNSGSINTFGSSIWRKPIVLSDDDIEALANCFILDPKAVAARGEEQVRADLVQEIKAQEIKARQARRATRPRRYWI